MTGDFRKDQTGRSLLPLDDHGRANGETAAFSAINRESTLREGVLRDGATQFQRSVVGAFDDLLQRVPFSHCVNQISVASQPAAPIAQDAARIVRMIAQNS